MPRPHNKALLLSESQKEREKLEKYINSLTPEQICLPGIVGEWTVKDVLMHLYEWEQMVLSWLSAGQKGETPHVPAVGYKWNQIPALNEAIFQRYAHYELDNVMKLFTESYQQIIQTIRQLSEETLFTSGLYPWMNKNTLASYFTSCTSSHYRWALKEIRKGVKAVS